MKRNALLLSVLSLITIIILVQIANPKELFKSLKDINLKYIGFAILLYVLRTLLKILRWHILVNATESKVKFTKSSLYCLIGISLNNITPVGLGGETVKAYLLNTEARVPTGRAIASIFTERIMDIIVLTSLAIIGIGLIFSELAPYIRINMLYSLFVIIGIIIVMIVIITHPTLLEKLGRSISKIIVKLSKNRGKIFEMKLNEAIQKFKKGMKDIFLAKKSTAFICFSLTVTIWLIQASRLYLILLAMNIEFHATFVQVIIASSIAMMLGVVLPWGAGNIAAITAVFTAVGISLKDATASGILEVLTSVWIIVPLGIFAMIHTGIKARSNEIQKNYLFSLELDYKKYFKNNALVDENIRKAFWENDFVLSSEATMFGRKNKWHIYDGAREYKIESEERKLNIYDKNKD